MMKGGLSRADETAPGNAGQYEKGAGAACANGSRVFIKVVMTCSARRSARQHRSVGDGRSRDAGGLAGRGCQ